MDAMDLKSAPEIVLKRLRKRRKKRAKRCRKIPSNFPDAGWCLKTVIKLSHGLEVHRSVSSTIHANKPHISEMALNVKKKQKERRPMSRQRSPLPTQYFTLTFSCLSIQSFQENFGQPMIENLISNLSANLQGSVGLSFVAAYLGGVLISFTPARIR